MLGAMLLVSSISSIASAQTVPNYTQSIRDLRSARYFLNQPDRNPGIQQNTSLAIGAIDQALNQLVGAANSVGQPANMSEPVNTNPGGQGRLHRAMTLIMSARSNIVYAKEADPNAHSYRQSAITPISQAATYTKRAITASHRDAS